MAAGCAEGEQRGGSSRITPGLLALGIWTRELMSCGGPAARRREGLARGSQPAAPTESMGIAVLCFSEEQEVQTVIVWLCANSRTNKILDLIGVRVVVARKKNDQKHVTQEKGFPFTKKSLWLI